MHGAVHSTVAFKRVALSERGKTIHHECAAWLLVAQCRVMKRGGGLALVCMFLDSVGESDYRPGVSVCYTRNRERDLVYL